MFLRPNDWKKRKFGIGNIGLLGIVFFLSSGSVNALPISKSEPISSPNRIGNVNLGRVLQLIKQGEPKISQNPSTPPDVIIDSEPGTQQPTGAPSPVSSDPRFGCEYVNGEYTVMYNPESQPGQSYPWAVPRQLGGGWTAQRRCDEITRRLESYRPDGLVELTTSTKNNYNIICVTTEADPSCRIVLTVPPGQDPQLTRDLIFENLLVADDGQQTQGVYTYTSRNRGGGILGDIERIFKPNSSNSGGRQTPKGINLKPFLDPADGGTGTQLRRGVSPSAPTQSKPGQLNPDIFR